MEANDKSKSKSVKLGVITADLTAARTREEAMLEVDRELQIRVRIYPEWVEAGGKLSMADARDRLERMAAASRILKAVYWLTDEQWEQVQAQAALAFQNQTGKADDEVPF